VHKVGRELGNVGEAEPFTSQCAAKVIEDLAHLSREIALTHQFPGFVDRELAGDE
jgi:hypothetical protein